MDLNRVTLIGRLTRDPELRTTPNGKSVATLSLVTNSVWKDQSGTKQEKPEFHTCILWGKLGEIAGQYLSKGRKAFVEGRLETRDWTGQDGVKRYKTEIIVDNLIMLDGGSGPAKADDNIDTGRPSTPIISQNDDEEEIKVEDIPF